MKRQGQRTDLTSANDLQKLVQGQTSRESIAKKAGTSHETIRLYIRLTNLIPEILDMVDNSVLDDAQRQTERPSGEDRPAGHRDGGAVDGADGAGAGCDGGTESVRSDEVGGPDEQHQGVGGGSGDGGTNLRQLSDPLPTEEEQQQSIDWTAVGSTGLQFSHHDFDARSEIPYYHEDSEKNELLRISDALKNNRMEIAAFFAEHTDGKNRGDFIKAFFNNTYVEKNPVQWPAGRVSGVG